MKLQHILATPDFRMVQKGIVNLLLHKAISIEGIYNKGVDQNSSLSAFIVCVTNGLPLIGLFNCIEEVECIWYNNGQRDKRLLNNISLDATKCGNKLLIRFFITFPMCIIAFLLFSICTHGVCNKSIIYMCTYNVQ